MVKSELAQKLCNAWPNILRKDIENILDIIFLEITEALHNDALGSCELRSFGRFSTKVQKARLGRNPASGTQISIPMKKKIRFKASSILLKRLNAN